MTRKVLNPLAVEWFRCPKCEHSFFVSLDDPEKHLLKKSMRCPNYVTCKGRIVTRTFTLKTQEIPKSRTISALELYQACAGLGLPNERECSPESIKALIGCRITDMTLTNSGDPKKSILVSMTLDSGQEVHLASSTLGAIIYKITGRSHVR